MLAMRPIFRFLLWLLIVALPLQGGAASMLPCVQLTPPILHGSHCAAQEKAQQQLEQKKPRSSTPMRNAAIAPPVPARLVRRSTLNCYWPA
ncbi:hypothetical protein ACFQT4_17075 [Pseudoduganella danionis]|uniref:hypothetical protein n=1 Tax=Pseudoduganella danionis TaxID=1890295 RepID=UPI0036186022